MSYIISEHHLYIYSLPRKCLSVGPEIQVLPVIHSGGELLLASCSQDCLIRVWRLCAKSGTDARTEDDHTIIKMKENVFEVKERGEQATLAQL